MHENLQKHFPKGLLQAEHSFRFAADSLLLAKFAKLNPYTKFVELGTGCGVVSFGLLLQAQSDFSNLGRLEDLNISGLGLDFYTEHLECANQNALNLGLAKHFIANYADFSKTHDLKIKYADKAQIYDLAIANPPWRSRVHGRISKHSIRADALFAFEHSFDNFCFAAAHFLRENGLFKLICVPEEQENILSALKKYNFHIESLDFTQLAESKKAQRLLICAKKYNNLFTN